MDKLWQTVKNGLKVSIPVHVYKMWIEPIQFLKVAGESIILTCPNNFLKKRVLENFSVLIKKELYRAAGRKLNFLLEVSRGTGKKVKPGKHDVTSINRQLVIPPVKNRPKNGRLLRRDFTFDRFVVGRNNDFAYSAALSLASQKKPVQNALLLLSQPGMGKSHLSQAAGHQILSDCPDERVFYVTAEDFTNEMVVAYRNNSIDVFKNKFRSCCDVLLLEDIHMLSGRTRTQEELALTLDYLCEAGKKIIFSSCMPLKSIAKISDQLKSRIAQSVISEIDPPDFRTRLRILRNKAKEKAITIPEKVSEYMASELTENVRLLESGIIGVATKSCLLGVPIDLSLAESVIRNIVTSNKNITIESIKQAVVKEFGISIKDIVSRSRKQSIVRPRQIAIFLSRRHTEQPIQSIGKSFNRYHATVIHSINTIEKELKLRSVTYKQVKTIERKLVSKNIN